VGYTIMTTYLIYSTQRKAQNALDEIYANAVQKAADDDRFLDPELRPVERKDATGRGGLLDTRDMLFNAQTKLWEEASTLSRAQKKDAAAYPLLGFRAGKLNIDSGYTTAWAIPQLIDKGIYAGSYAFPDPANDVRFGDKTGIVEPQATVEAAYGDLFNEDTP